MALAAAGALLAGETEATATAMALKLAPFAAKAKSKDTLNQYSFPYGAPVLRNAIAKYYAKRYPTIECDAERNVTVVMGATEGFACAVRALTKPGDAVAFFQPFHELYPSQVAIFHLEPRAVTLSASDDRWTFDVNELEAALNGAALFLFNDPHNPTGHVFTAGEKFTIARLCAKHNVVCVTDEIYEHIHYGPKHESLAQLPAIRENVVVVHSISKTAKATGWRIGWVVASEERTKLIRGIHDQLVACCPTPLQFGAAALLQDHAGDGADKTLAAISVEYGEKRDRLATALKKAGFDLGPAPQGAYYIFAGYRGVSALKGKGPREAAMYMTKTVKVACVPGDNFYLEPQKSSLDHGQKYLRFAFVRSLDVIDAAANNLAKLL